MRNITISYRLEHPSPWKPHWNMNLQGDQLKECSMGKTAASPFQVKIHNDHKLDAVHKSHLDTEIHLGARILASFYVPVSVPGCLGDPFEPEVHNN